MNNTIHLVTQVRNPAVICDFLLYNLLSHCIQFYLLNISEFVLLIFTTRVKNQAANKSLIFLLEELLNIQSLSPPFQLK